MGVDIVGFSTSNTFSHRGMMLSDLGRLDEAWEAFRRCDEIARSRDENEQVNWNDFFWSFAIADAGDAAGALLLARRAVDSSEKIGSTVNRVGAHGALGIALALDGEWQVARESLEFALQLMRAGESGGFYEPQLLTALTEAHRGLGDETRARELAGEAVEAGERTGIRVGELRAQLARARVLLAFDGLEARPAIEAALERAQAVVEETGARGFEPQILLERGRLAGLVGDELGREDCLREAHRLFTEMGATGRAERAALLLGQSPR